MYLCIHVYMGVFIQGMSFVSACDQTCVQMFQLSFIVPVLLLGPDNTFAFLFV